MKFSYVYLLLAANFLTTVVTYYRKCYKEFSVCLITNIDDARYPYKFRLNQRSADDWCKRNSSSLTIITNATVQSAIEAFIKDASAKLDSDVITDGYRFPLDNWEWTNGNRSDNYPFSERSYYRYGYLKVSAGRVVLLTAGNPTTKRNFICSHLSHNSNCPNDHHQLGSSCYKIHNSERANWFNARNLCLQEGYDLAIFEDNDLSSISGRLSYGEYWIGLRNERWDWFHGQKPAAINYSNWDNNSPNAIGGNCLCLTASTGKWKDCDCYQKHRYICTEDYTPDSSGASASTTTLLTKDTTVTTRSDPSSLLITIVDDSYKQPDDSRLLLVIGLGIVCLLILIAATAVVVHFKTRRRKKRTVQTKSPLHPVRDELQSSTDAYEMLDPSEQTGNKTYAELQLYETVEDDAKQDTNYRNIPNNTLYSNVG